MKKIAFVVAIGALGSMASACPSTPRTDAGMTTPDTGTIVIPDTGVSRDAFRRPDTNMVAMTCSMYGGITPTSIAAVPASCTPRCANATLGAINACPTNDMGTCLFGALMADTTPSVSMPAGGGAIDVDCGTCFDLNRFHCFSLVCSAQASPYLLCDSTMDPDMCMGEQMALNTCLMGIAAGSPARMMLDECFMTEVTACFDTSGAFAPNAAAVRMSGGTVRAPQASLAASLR